jgi:hypothetical protein
VGWLLPYPIEKCSWVVLQLHELYSFGPIWVFPHKDENQSFVVTRVMQDEKKNNLFGRCTFCVGLLDRHEDTICCGVSLCVGDTWKKIMAATTNWCALALSR